MDKPEVISALTTLGWLDLIRRIGGFMVIAGVAIEVGGDWLSAPFHKTVEDARQLELSRLSAEATSSRAAIADANARALEAQAELEKFKGPRLLTDEQLARIAGKLVAFKGQEYAITTFWDVKEPLAISNRLHQALTMAGWTYIPPGPGGAFLLGGVVGVQVWSHPSADQQVRDAAKMLIEALNAEDIEAFAKEQSPQNPKDNKIALNVGTKF
jgi:hypothetical protein